VPMNSRRVTMKSSPISPLFRGVSSLEDCNLGTAKRNPDPRSFARGNARHDRCARLRAVRAPQQV